jgi:hypothetical protein
MQKAKRGPVRKKSRLGSARDRKGGCYQSVSEAVVMFTSCVHFTNFFLLLSLFLGAINSPTRGTDQTGRVTEIEIERGIVQEVRLHHETMGFRVAIDCFPIPHQSLD